MLNTKPLHTLYNTSNDIGILVNHYKNNDGYDYASAINIVEVYGGQGLATLLEETGYNDHFSLFKTIQILSSNRKDKEICEFLSYLSISSHIVLLEIIERVSSSRNVDTSRVSETVEYTDVEIDNLVIPLLKSVVPLLLQHKMSAPLYQALSDVVIVLLQKPFSSDLSISNIVDLVLDYYNLNNDPSGLEEGTKFLLKTFEYNTLFSIPDLISEPDFCSMVKELMIRHNLNRQYIFTVPGNESAGFVPFHTMSGAVIIHSLGYYYITAMSYTLKRSSIQEVLGNLSSITEYVEGILSTIEMEDVSIRTIVVEMIGTLSPQSTNSVGSQSLEVGKYLFKLYLVSRIKDYMEYWEEALAGSTAYEKEDTTASIIEASTGYGLTDVLEGVVGLSESIGIELAFLKDFGMGYEQIEESSNEFLKDLTDSYSSRNDSDNAVVMNVLNTGIRTLIIEIVDDLNSRRR